MVWKCGYLTNHVDFVITKWACLESPHHSASPVMATTSKQVGFMDVQPPKWWRISKKQTKNIARHRKNGGVKWWHQRFEAIHSHPQIMNSKKLYPRIPQVNCNKTSVGNRWIYSILQPSGNIFFRGIFPEANESHRRLIDMFFMGKHRRKHVFLIGTWWYNGDMTRI